MPQLPDDKPVTVSQVKGLNQRSKFTNPEIAQFDVLRGLIPQRDGILQRINGTKFLQYIEGRQILNLHQTFDRRKNFLVQTDRGVYLYSEDELLSRVTPTNLVPVIPIEEENMSKAIIVHTTASGVVGGTCAAGGWFDAPLSAILSQRNPDGSAATFVTALAGNAFTLATGIYRFSGWSIGCASGAAANSFHVRLLNVTTALPLFNGLENEVGMPARTPAVANVNTVAMFGGDIDLSVTPTQIKLQHYMENLSTNVGFGRPHALGFKNVFRWIEILKTA